MYISRIKKWQGMFMWYKNYRFFSHKPLARLSERTFAVAHVKPIYQKSAKMINPKSKRKNRANWISINEAPQH